jgi:hypothetical protein
MTKINMNEIIMAKIEMIHISMSEIIMAKIKIH